MGLAHVTLGAKSAELFVGEGDELFLVNGGARQDAISTPTSGFSFVPPSADENLAASFVRDGRVYPVPLWQGPLPTVTVPQELAMGATVDIDISPRPAPGTKVFVALRSCLGVASVQLETLPWKLDTTTEIQKNAAQLRGVLRRGGDRPALHGQGRIRIRDEHATVRERPVPSLERGPRAPLPPVGHLLAALSRGAEHDAPTSTTRSLHRQVHGRPTLDELGLRVRIVRVRRLPVTRSFRRAKRANRAGERTLRLRCSRFDGTPSTRAASSHSPVRDRRRGRSSDPGVVR